MTPEGKVKARVKRALAALPGKVYSFMPVQTGYGAPTLDFLICYRGRFFAIETKTGKKVPTARQEATMGQMTDAGAIVLVVNEDNVDHLDAIIQTHAAFAEEFFDADDQPVRRTNPRPSPNGRKAAHDPFEE